MFKKGDKVKCVDAEDNMLISVGVVYEVLSHDPLSGLVKLAAGPDQYYHKCRFELVSKYPNPKHVHHDAIVEWARGATIQYKNACGNWQDVSNNLPDWRPGVHILRVKPNLSPQEEEKQAIIEEMQKLQDRLDKLEVS